MKERIMEEVSPRHLALLAAIISITLLHALLTS